MNTGSFLKGVATGAAIGVSLSMIMSPVDKKDVRRVQKNASRMFTTVGSMLDNLLSNMQ